MKKNIYILTFQADILRVLKLNDFIKGSIYIIQAKYIKLFIVLMWLKDKMFSNFSLTVQMIASKSQKILYHLKIVSW